MEKKKQIAAILLALLMLLGVLAGCGNESNTEKNDKLKIVTTIFPLYDWAGEIIGDEVKNAEITLLPDNGVDLHSFQPTADDIIKISTCDMFIYVGGESDKWVDDALKNATNKDMKVLNLLDILGDSVKTEEAVEGMQEDDREHEAEKDEHIWLSLKNAEVLVGGISDALQELDLGNKETYKANATNYIEKLTALDSEYKKVIADANKKTVLFGDRFPFRYLADDYGLKYHAAFVGCSAETEASFETVSFLAKKVDELQLTCILTVEGTQHKIAETIVENTAEKNQKVLTMDSMQSTTSKDIENGVTYLSAMEKNLTVLKEALN